MTLDEIETGLSRIEQWRKENWLAKIGILEFSRTTEMHRMLVDLRDVSGGTPEQQIEFRQRTAKTIKR